MFFPIPARCFSHWARGNETVCCMVYGWYDVYMKVGNKKSICMHGSGNCSILITIQLGDSDRVCECRTLFMAPLWPHTHKTYSV